MLDGVDRLPAPPDEEPDVFAHDAAQEHALGLVDLDVDVQTKPLDDLLEELLEDFRRLELLVAPELLVDPAVELAHRRLPERFFFLRGGGGGAERLLLPLPALLPLPPTPASAGSARAPPDGGSGLPSGERPSLPGRPGGTIEPMCRLMSSCCPIVHVFVVIQ